LPQKRTADFGILCPIPEEWEAACRRLNSPTIPPNQSLPTRFGDIAGLRVVCVNSGKGEGATAACLQLMLDIWRPRWVLLVGIAGGFPSQDVHKGDLVIARYIYNFEFGKLTAGKFLRRPDYDFGPDRRLFAYAETIMKAEGEAWKQLITAERPDKQNPIITRAHDGYVASSSKVVDDPDHEFYAAVKATIPEVHAVEMEASGAGAAIALEKSQRPVGFLMIRGISDEPIGTEESQSGTQQRREWKIYAANVASAFAYQLITVVSESLKQSSSIMSEDISQRLDPLSPEQLSQSLRVELTRYLKSRRAGKESIVSPSVAILHGEHFPAKYLTSLVQLLQAGGVICQCPALQRKRYSYAQAISECSDSCTHFLFLGRSAKELNSGWAAYASFLAANKQRFWMPRIAGF